MTHDYVSLLIRVARLINLTVEFSRVKKINQEEQTKFLHEAEIVEKSLRTVGIGASPRTSEQD